MKPSAVEIGTWAWAHRDSLLCIGLAISEFLGLNPKFKANSLIQLAMNAIFKKKGV